MIRVEQVRVPSEKIDRSVPFQEQILPYVAKKLKCRADEILSLVIRRHSIDARKKPVIYDVFTVDVGMRLDDTEDGSLCINTLHRKTVPSVDTLRPVVVGFGPAGMFCAYELAQQGYRPIVIERGADVDARVEAVERFWKDGVLLPDTNVQFGEGGAGTFSDGKLNSGIKDREGRIEKVLRIFVEHGAPENILYEAEPHIGTDLLRDVVKRIREHIIALGGEVRFCTKLNGIVVENGRVSAANVTATGSDQETETVTTIATDTILLAIGHSARDTFLMLRDMEVAMEQKAFAVGLRVLHPQKSIDAAQYGESAPAYMPPASYKLTHQTAFGRGVYTFCMCPGGYVVNASSEEGGLCVNGMSDHRRDSGSANSAVVVQVRPEDYVRYVTEQALKDEKGSTVSHEDPLAGMYFQRWLERRAYAIGQGAVPVETWEDFVKGCEKDCTENGSLCPKSGHSRTVPSAVHEEPALMIPYLKGRYRFAAVHDILPDAFNQCIIEGMEAFGRKIQGFDAPDTLLAGVESRTSSPVRIVRDESMQSVNVRGLYPVGEGAGYAGGIMSAAVDGLKAAERVSLYPSL